MNDARGELEKFIHAASHDLQQPVSKIIIFSEMLMMKLKDVGQAEKDQLARIHDSAKSMKRFIEDLTRYSTTLSAETHPENVDLKKLHAEVMADLGSEVEASHAKVELGRSDTFTADRPQMKEALEHLILNSIKFSKQGVEPRIRIESRSEKGRTEISVEDNGIGFEEKFAEKIFEPFQKLHPKSAYAGNGIGLSIVKKIADNHGGRVAALGKPGEGARFVITLPHD